MGGPEDLKAIAAQLDSPFLNQNFNETINEGFPRTRTLLSNEYTMLTLIPLASLIFVYVGLSCLKCVIGCCCRSCCCCCYSAKKPKVETSESSGDKKKD